MKCFISFFLFIKEIQRHTIYPFTAAVNIKSLLAAACHIQFHSTPPEVPTHFLFSSPNRLLTITHVCIFILFGLLFTCLCTFVWEL